MRREGKRGERGKVGEEREKREGGRGKQDNPVFKSEKEREKEIFPKILNKRLD